MGRKILIGLCQMQVCEDKAKNIQKARELIKQAGDEGCLIAILPEMFICPYDTSCFREYAEPSAGGRVFDFLSSVASEFGMIIIGGSIPEATIGGSVYNTSLIFDSSGHLVGRHRKAHLFDIDIKNGIKFKESDVLTAGNEITVIDTPLIKMGVGICYDIRFPEFARAMVQKGAEILIYPAAFNNITGPAHWELLLRARAVDNQLFTAGVSSARNESASYKAYGHSMICDPWGNTIAKTDHKEGLVIGEIDLEKIYSIREQLPVLRHRRPKLYS